MTLACAPRYSSFVDQQLSIVIGFCGLGFSSGKISD